MERKKFIGIVEMPEIRPKDNCLILDKTLSGMAFIEHPDGYLSEKYNTNVLIVDYKKHLK